MLKTATSRLKSALIFLFILAYWLKAYSAPPLATDAIAVIIIAIFAISLRDLKPLNRKLIFLLLLGSGMLIYIAPGNTDWSDAICDNAGIVSLLLSVPMLSAILHYGPYDTVILTLANSFIRGERAYYTAAMGLVAFLASLLTLAAVPFSYQLLRPLAARYPVDTLHQAFTRGFIINLFWAPHLVTVAVVLQYVNISWQDIAGAGVCFAVLLFTIACLLFSPRSRQQPVGAPAVGASPAAAIGPQEKRWLLTLLAQVGLVMGVVMILSRYAPKSVFAIVSVVSIVMPLLLAIALGKTSVYAERFRHYLGTVLPGMDNEFLLFITIGFFGNALGKALTAASYQTRLAGLGGIDPGLLSLSIIIAIAGLSIGGLHPIITISSLSIAFREIHLSLANAQLAITFITGYTLYLILSPFSSLVMVMAGLTGRNVYQMGLQLNWRFALVVALTAALVIRIWAA